MNPSPSAQKFASYVLALVALSASGASFHTALHAARGEVAFVVGLICVLHVVAAFALTVLFWEPTSDKHQR